MKKRIKRILLIMFIIVYGIVLKTNAAGANVVLKSDKTEIEPGDSFTIKLSASCEEGINGLTGKLIYNSEELELISSKISDGNWSSLGQNSEGSVEIAIIGNSEETIKNAEIFEVTFKAKDNVKRGSVIKVTPSNIVLDSDAEENSEHKDIEVNTISLNVKEISTPKEPENKVPTKVETTNNNSEQPDKKIPNTGKNIFIEIATIALGTMLVVSYVSYKRYKNV